MAAASAAVIAAAVMFGNLAPADAARAGGSGGGGGGMGAHPATVQHSAMPSMVNSCPMPACRGGSRMGGPAGAFVAHPPVTQKRITSDWKHECGNDPDCRHHHHHYDGNYYAFFYNNGPYYYQAEPDCWVWSHRLHHWVWACGPSYPGYY
jgi:hypothetical protein